MALTESPQSLYLDLETRSQIDLPTYGLMRYSQDPTTEAICMCWAFDDEPIKEWFAEDGPFPAEVIDYIENSDRPIIAQKASFERHMFDFVLSNDYEFQPPASERWHCSSARAMAHGLPGNLKDICRALDMKIQKMAEGTRLIREYSAPGFLTEWKPGDKKRMADYCRVDVETMRAFCSVLRELTPEEWRQYHVTEYMNDRGVPLDIPFVTAALSYSDEVRADVSQNIIELTGGRVRKPTERKSRDLWLADHLSPELLALITVEKKGVKKVKFDKEYRQILANHPDTPEIVEHFVELVEQAGGATIGKYTRMRDMHVDNRVHGAMIWNGAGGTGRYCIAEDSEITVLNRALEIKVKPIQNLCYDDLVWDGEKFVQHGGLVDSGIREVMIYDGVEATPDHVVFTEEGFEVSLLEAYERNYTLKISERPTRERFSN